VLSGFFSRMPRAYDDSSRNSERHVNDLFDVEIRGDAASTVLANRQKFMECRSYKQRSGCCKDGLTASNEYSW
jgi:hypothetical protein